jgi:hypothetical protein
MKEGKKCHALIRCKRYKIALPDCFKSLAQIDHSCVYLCRADWHRKIRAQNILYNVASLLAQSGWTKLIVDAMLLADMPRVANVIYRLFIFIGIFYTCRLQCFYLLALCRLFLHIGNGNISYF